MTAAQLQQLTATLAPAQAARAQQRYSQQRGGRARRATGNTPVAIRQCTLTVRPPSRTFWVSASIHTNV